MFIILLILVLATSNEIILFSGLLDWDDEKLMIQYNLYNSYYQMNLITGSSILLYGIGSDGMVETLNTSKISHITSHEFQQSLKKIGLKTFPTFFCDTTIGMCSNVDYPLSYRLEQLYNNKNKFIETTIKNALKYNWDGYYFDLEPIEMIDNNKITNFIIEWALSLKKINRTLNIWIGGSSYYNTTLLYSNSNIYLTTMNTYNSYYDVFITTASQYYSQISNISLLSYGLLTYDNEFENANESSVLDIMKWAKITKPYSISLWASHIPPKWYMGLKYFLL